MPFADIDAADLLDMIERTFFAMALKIEGPVSLEGDRASDKVGCGGVHQVWESPAPGPISFFMPRLRGARF